MSKVPVDNTNVTQFLYGTLVSGPDVNFHGPRGAGKAVGLFQQTKLSKDPGGVSSTWEEVVYETKQVRYYTQVAREPYLTLKSKSEAPSAVVDFARHDVSFLGVLPGQPSSDSGSNITPLREFALLDAQVRPFIGPLPVRPAAYFNGHASVVFHQHPTAYPGHYEYEGSPLTLPMTLAFWVRRDVPWPGQGLARIATFFEYKGVHVSHEEAGTLALSNAHGLVVTLGGQSLQSEISIDDLAWHHLAVSLEDRGGGQAAVRLFHNGEQAPLTSDGNANPEGAIALNWERVYSHLQVGSGAFAGQIAPFAGQIARFTVWNTVLSAYDIFLVMGTKTQGASLVWLLDKEPEGADAFNVQYLGVGRPLPGPGHLTVDVNTDQANGRKATVRGSGPALGEVFGNGEITVDIDGLGSLQIDVAPTMATINGQEWKGEKTLTISVEEKGRFTTNEPVVEGYVRGRLGITSRSVLVEDYDGPGFSAVHHVYRSSIRFPLTTDWVDMYSERPMEVRVTDATTANATVTLQPDTPHRVFPNIMGAVVVTTNADEFIAPAILLATNEMPPGVKSVVCPDVEAHQKICHMDLGMLFEKRDTMGMDNHSDESCAAVQKAMQNVARAIHHTYNRVYGGTCHDRLINPSGMADTHWSLTFDENGQASYDTLSKEAVVTKLAGAPAPIDVPMDNMDAYHKRGWTILWTILSDFASGLKNAEEIIVHTATAVGHDVVDTGVTTWNDLNYTVAKAGNDLVQGDYAGTVEDFFGGFARTGADVIKGGENLGRDVASGGGQLLVVTLKTGEDVAQYVISHTGVAGPVLGWLFEKLGPPVETLIEDLAGKLDWTDILSTQKAINNAFDAILPYVKDNIESWKSHVTSQLEALRGTFDQHVDSLISDFEGKSLTPDITSTDTGHSSAIERMEWLLSQVFIVNLSPAGEEPIGEWFEGGQEQDPLVQMLSAFNDRLKSSNVPDDLNALWADLSSLAADPANIPETMIRVALRSAKTLLDAVFALIETSIEEALDLLVDAIGIFTEFVTTPLNVPFLSDLCAAIDDGNQMTLLNFTTLLLAAPATLISKAMDRGAPFKNGLTLSLGTQTGLVWTPTPDEEVDEKCWMGVIYGVAQILDGIMSAALDLQYDVVVGTQDPGYGRRWEELNTSRRVIPPDYRRRVSAIAVAVQVAALCFGPPRGHWRKGILPWDGTGVVGNRDRLVNAIWFYQWIFVALPDIFSVAWKGMPFRFRGPFGNKRTGAVFSGVFEAIHWALKIVLAVTENHDVPSELASGRRGPPEYDHLRTLCYVVDPMKGMLETLLVAETDDLWPVAVVCAGDVALQTTYGVAYIYRALHNEL